MIGFKKPNYIWSEWKEAGTPEYKQEKIEPYKTIQLHFNYELDMEDLSKLINQKITNRTRYIYHPSLESRGEIKSYKNKRWIGSKNPKYPIYIISKGRWESRLTSKALERKKCPYRIVIEPQEYDRYSKVINPKKILVLPFSNLGKGSIPARNWVWEHSIKEGHKKHWILDDNISQFFRLNNNICIPIYRSGIEFRIFEDFIDRYENVPMSGFNYFMFVELKAKIKPFNINTRIYSCILLDNRFYKDFPWRGIYNEDTDLSLRFLKAGYCTVLSNVFSCRKMTTMKMKGGNTDLLYKDGDDSRKKMTESLIKQHPDCVKKTWKFGHTHHQVNYRKFKKNRLIKKPDAMLKDTNEYGMKLQEKINGKWRTTNG
jgi:hypothetical protein